MQGEHRVAISQEEHLEELSKGYRFDWKDAVNSVFTPKRGPVRSGRRGDLRAEERAGLDAEVPAEGPEALRACARCRGGAPTCPTSTSRTSTTSSAPRRSRPRTGRTCPRTSEGTWDKLGIPEAEKKYLGGVSARSTSARSSTTRSRRSSTTSACCSPTWTPPFATTPTWSRSTSARSSRPNDNKFAALNTAVWSGGSFIYVPPGVHVDIPLQAYFRINAENMGQFERTLIIADEGSLRALRGGLLGPDLHERLAALRGRRDHGEEGRARPLHHDPELVHERLQPGDQARRRLRGRRDGVGRRQHRLEGHHEVPVDLPAGQGRPRRGALRRVRRQGHAHRRGRQGDPRRAVHDQRDHVEVGLEGRRPHRLPRASFAWSPTPTTRSPTCDATR